MSFWNTISETRWGPWFAAGLGVLWVVFLALLVIHLARRRTGYYRREDIVSKTVSRAVLWLVDVPLFLAVCAFAYLLVRFFTPMPVSWLFRVGVLSATFVVIAFLALLRQDLTSRIDAQKKRCNENTVPELRPARKGKKHPGKKR